MTICDNDILYDIHYDTYQEHFQIRWTSDVPVKKDTLVNDGDIKVIQNKF